LALVQADETPTVKEELHAIEGEVLRGISLLEVRARAVSDSYAELEVRARAVSDSYAELEVSLQIAARDLRDAHRAVWSSR